MTQTAEKNKAVKIRALLEAGYSTTAAADIVGCHPGYARAVKVRQSGLNGVAKCELLARNAGDREKARKAAKDAYAKAKNDGLDRHSALKKYWAAYTRVLYATGRAVLRSQREFAA